jgi:tetratricopeptide (TPR) repeat protein
MTHSSSNTPLAKDIDLAQQALDLAQLLRTRATFFWHQADATNTLSLADRLDRWAQDLSSMENSDSASIIDLDRKASFKPSRSTATTLPSVAALLGKDAPIRPAPTMPARRWRAPIESRLQSLTAEPAVHHPVSALAAEPASSITLSSSVPILHETPSSKPRATEPRPSMSASTETKRVPSPTPSPRASEFLISHRSKRVVDRADWSLSARWWNVPLALAFAIGLAVAIGGAGVETIRVARSQSILSEIIQNPKSTSQEVAQAARESRTSPLHRWDAMREWSVARATLVAIERTSPRMSPIDHANQQENVRNLFRRAAERHPSSPYHLLNRALTASQPDSERLWEELSAKELTDPILAEQVALYRVRSGDKKVGLASLQTELQNNPSRTGPVIRSLLDSGLSASEATAIVPNHPTAWGTILDLNDTQARIGLRRAIEDRLTQFDERATTEKRTAADWGDWGAVEARLERRDRATDAYKKAIELDPTSTRYKLSLAEVRAAQREWDEARRLLAELPVRLSPEQAGQREKILTTIDQSTGRIPSGGSIRAN